MRLRKPAFLTSHSASRRNYKPFWKRLIRSVVNLIISMNARVTPPYPAKQAVIRFSTRCQSALRDYLYLSAWAVLDGAARKPLGSLPLFLRHGPGAR